MRYVYLAVAIGLLVVGTGSYTATAAQGGATHSGRLISVLPSASHMTFSVATAGDRLYQAHAAFAAKQEDEKRNREALQRYGSWGPDLVQAAQKYGQDPDRLYRVMMCESGGDPQADNGVCKGLFQFDPRTWAGTPFGSQSIFDGQAQIEAAAWMFSQGRANEWTCR